MRDDPFKGPGRLLRLFVFIALLIAPLYGGPLFLKKQKPGDFLKSIYGEKIPSPQSVWIKKEIRQKVESILGHRFGQIRVRSWVNGETSVWILDEIGKEEPITFGIVVKAGQVDDARVLIYRETRGFEIMRKAFREQFAQATISSDLKLDRRIDGISGATLSVRAMTKIVRIALYLDRVLRS